MSKLCKGVGLGLRAPHFEYILKYLPAVAWLEVHPCNYLRGHNKQALLRVSEHYPISFHGVNLNLGGIEPLDKEYLQLLKKAASDIQPGLVSDHACFTSLNKRHFHDLLPVPFTYEAVRHISQRILQVQDALGRQIAIENISRYTCYSSSEMYEGEFLSEIAEAADCTILFDINNAYVNQKNLGEPALSQLAAIPINRISELHLAGFSERQEKQETFLVDTHSAPVHPTVWRLLENFIDQIPGLRDIPCLIEWDSQIPPFELLLKERDKAESIFKKQTVRLQLNSF